LETGLTRLGNGATLEPGAIALAASVLGFFLLVILGIDRIPFLINIRVREYAIASMPTK
jgi:hypothetical protein